MWGQNWGSMIWGNGAAVPAWGPLGWVLAGMALALAASWALRRSRLAAGAMLLVAFVVLPVVATAVTIPHVFTNGAVADASAVNENFSALATAVTDLEALPVVQTPALLPGWFNYGGALAVARYYRDDEGIVHLEGVVRDGGGPIFVLPEGYRPLQTHLFPVIVFSNQLGRIEVKPDGAVALTAGSNTWVSLDGISFRAE